MQSEVIASKQCYTSMWDPACHNKEMFCIDPSTQLGAADLEIFFLSYV